jgi:hypothetical protein
MNYDGLRVVFRTGATFVSAGLELENHQAFAVISAYGPKDTKEVIGRERLELDILFLQKINEYEYLYKELVELPEPDRSGPVMVNRESDRNSHSQKKRLSLGR